MPPPHAAQRVDDRERSQSGRRVVGVHGVEHGVPVGADLDGARGTAVLALGQARVLDAAAVALEPLRLGQCADPIGGLGGKRVERGPDGLGGELQPVHLPDVGDDVSGVGPLAAPLAEEAPVAAGVEDAVEQHLLGAAVDEPRPELAEHARVEARVVEREAEEVLPVDPSADGVGGPAVGEVLSELEHGHQREPPGRVGGLPEVGVERGEVVVGEHGAELVAEGEKRRSFREGGAGDPRRVGRDRAGRLRLEHGRDGGGRLLPRSAQEVPSDFASSIPPFSQTAGRLGRRRVPTVGTDHVLQALRRLDAGGRLVAVLSAGVRRGKPTRRAFFEAVDADPFRLRADIEVGGAVYRPYGTSVRTRVLVVDHVCPRAPGGLRSRIEAVVDSVAEGAAALAPCAAER